MKASLAYSTLRLMFWHSKCTLKSAKMINTLYIFYYTFTHVLYNRYYPPAFCVFFSGWGTGPRRPAFDLMNQVKQEGTSLRPTYRAQNNKASLVMAVRRLSKDWKLNNTAYHNSTPTTATQQHLSGSWQYKATPFKVFDKGQWQVFESMTAQNIHFAMGISISET